MSEIVALKMARAYIAADRDGFLKCHATPPDYDIASMEERHIEMLGRVDILLGDIDTAIEHTEASAKREQGLREALECWPLREMLGMVEDSGDEAMWERARWFMEVRDKVLAEPIPLVRDAA